MLNTSRSVFDTSYRADALEARIDVTHARSLTYTNITPRIALELERKRIAIMDGVVLGNVSSYDRSAYRQKWLALRALTLVPHETREVPF